MSSEIVTFYSTTTYIQPTCGFIKLFCVLEKVDADKWLNETRLWNIKCHPALL